CGNNSASASHVASRSQLQRAQRAACATQREWPRHIAENHAGAWLAPRRWYLIPNCVPEQDARELVSEGSPEVPAVAAVAQAGPEGVAAPQLAPELVLRWAPQAIVQGPPATSFRPECL